MNASFQPAERRFNHQDPTPGLTLWITLEEFRKIHRRALYSRMFVRMAAKRDGLEYLDYVALRLLVEALRAGERLSSAETGEGIELAPRYSDEIVIVESAINKKFAVLCPA